MSAATRHQVAVPAGAAYEWKAVSLLSIAFGLVGLDRWIIAPLAPAIIADLNLRPQDINNLVAILGVTWGISALIMGGLSDRIGRRKVLLPAILLFSLCAGLSGVAGGFTGLLLIRGVMGAAEGAFCPTSFAATAEASKPARRGFNQGLQQSMFALLGLGFGPIIATWLLGFMSWRGVFLLVTLPGLVLACLLWLVIREPPVMGAADSPVPAPAKVSPGCVLRVRNIRLGMLGLLCAMCGIFVLSANVPLYLANHLGLSPAQMGIVTSAIGFGGFVGQWGLPALSDFAGRRPMAVAGFAGGALFLFAFIQTGSHPLLLFVNLFAATSFSFGLLALLTGPVAAEAAPPGMMSTASGVIIGVGEIVGGGLALVIAGMVITRFGIEYMLYLALGGLLAGTVLMLFLNETAPRRMARKDLTAASPLHPNGIET
jgi:predicted MFS family arabinose efflux permease